MTPDLVITLAKETVELTLLICLPMLAVGLVVGVAIGLLQALTQIQEMTLVMVPKIVAILLTLLLTLPWIMNKMTAYTSQLILNIPVYAK
ncbi:MAG: flagellar biosynthesis protein FliQ [Desulfobacterota bacterium]|jgi:flagellar biosynthesis protein FliQ|nr:flagellar biosynthesis protein FliQ [Thermodesulfobacteriota bacterium]